VKRHAAAALVLLAVGIGIVDPYACVQYSSGEALERAIPEPERARLVAVAERALKLVPAPRGYTADGPPSSGQADEKAAWSEATQKWTSLPAARAERAYEPRTEGDSAPPALEVRLLVNGPIGVPDGLASVGGAPRILPIRGAASVEVTTVGAEQFDTPATGGHEEGGRVVMPVTPADAANALTIIRTLIADPASERALKASASGGAVAPTLPRASARADRVASITVELYGAKRDVEALNRRLPIAALRRLLTPR
jgi:hypothetical protein